MGYLPAIIGSEVNVNLLRIISSLFLFWNHRLCCAFRQWTVRSGLVFGIEAAVGDCMSFQYETLCLEIILRG